MGLLLIGAFYFFGAKVKRLFLIMKSVDGTSPGRPDRIPERIGVLIKDVLGQTNVRRKKMPGWAHTLIFFGFLVFMTGSQEYGSKMVSNQGKGYVFLICEPQWTD